jgi:hypothetical protein
MVTRLDRLARSTRDLLNTLASIAAKKAGFRSLGERIARNVVAAAVARELPTSRRRSIPPRNTEVNNVTFEMPVCGHGGGWRLNEPRRYDPDSGSQRDSFIALWQTITICCISRFIPR